MSSKYNNLIVQSISYQPTTGEVQYRFSTGAEEVEFSGSAKSVSGIRSVEFPDAFDEFLRNYCASNPGVVRELVGLTWKRIDGAGVDLPARLVSPAN